MKQVQVLTPKDVENFLLNNSNENFSKIHSVIRSENESLEFFLMKIFSEIKTGTKLFDYRVNKITKPDLPIIAYEDFSAFKLFVLDVGLLGAMTGLEAETIIDGNRIFEEFKGAIAEQYVLQQFKTIKDLPVMYWSNETSRAEVDFVIQLKSNVVPVEVKAEKNLQAKSLKVYMEKFKPNYAIRTSMADYKKTENLIDLPLYCIDECTQGDVL